MRIGSLHCLLALLLLNAWAAADQTPTSFQRDVRPILQRSCAGCHRPGKMKGKLDVTTYAALAHGGKKGTEWTGGEPDKSRLVQMVSGDDPEMPSKGEKLSAAEVSTLARWVAEGAKDDSQSTAGLADSPTTPAPKAYALAPVISALALSPDATVIAVGGCREVLLRSADGAELLARLPSECPHLTSMRFTPDGGRLVTAGGSTGEFGQLEVYDVAARKRIASYRVCDDTLFGLSLSPSGDRAGVACADHTARVISLEDGTEIDHIATHTDWALASVFNLDGSRLVTVGRDKFVWVYDLPSHKPVDPINDPTDAWLSVARHPKQDTIVCGSATGATRSFRLTDLKASTEQNREPNRIRDLENMGGPVSAIEFSADGKWMAFAGKAEVRIFSADGNTKRCACSGGVGPVFAIAFSPDASKLYAAGFDGQVRIFDAEHGKLLKEFVPVPIETAER